MRRICSIEECDRVAVGRGWCNMHYKRWWKHGDTGVGRRTRPQSRKQSRGYTLVLVDPNDKFASMANCDGYALEHRLVMARHLGRHLQRVESVHHLNGIKDDNRLENLEIWSSSHPAGQRVADMLTWAREIIALYGEAA